jgi:hypothetical protein
MFAGAISMGLGAWLAAESDRKAYYVEEARERQEVENCPDKEEEEIYEIFDQYHISREASRSVVEALKVNKDCWVQVSSPSTNVFHFQFSFRLLKTVGKVAG